MSPFRVDDGRVGVGGVVRPFGFMCEVSAWRVEEAEEVVAEVEEGEETNKVYITKKKNHTHKSCFFAFFDVRPLPSKGKAHLNWCS